MPSSLPQFVVKKDRTGDDHTGELDGVLRRLHPTIPKGDSGRPTVTIIGGVSVWRKTVTSYVRNPEVIHVIY